MLDKEVHPAQVEALKGTVIHFHDIMIPYAYYLNWHEDGTLYWNESYFLHAFLMFNDTWKTIFSSRYFQQNKYSTLKDLAPSINLNQITNFLFI